MKFFAFLLSLTLLSGCISQPDYRRERSEPATVMSVDLERYSGTWHEVARYPNWFQRNCGATTATYGLRQDGRISVLNVCEDVRKPGETITAKGSARVVDGSDGAKLKVRFTPGWVPFAEGDYWVFHLEPDYSMALVGDPDGKYLWLLARAPDPSDILVSRAMETAQSLGFETDPLVFSKAASE